MTYVHIIAFELFNEGKSKTHLPPSTGPSPRATHEQKQRRPPAPDLGRSKSPNREEPALLEALIYAK